MKTFYVHRNSGNAVFVKAGDFFVEQGGLKEVWGKAWKPIQARDLGHARQIAEKELPMVSFSYTAYKAGQVTLEQMVRGHA